MTGRLATLAAFLALAGCTVGIGTSPPLISGHTPADASAAGSSEPQPPGSLPPGAQGLGGGPNATQNSLASATFSAPRR